MCNRSKRKRLYGIICNRRSGGRAPPRCNGFGGRSIPDADGSELQPLREIQVVDLGVVCKKSKQTRPYGTMWHRRLIQLKELTTWISRGSCSSPDLVASWEELRPPESLHLGGPPPLFKHLEPWRLRFRTTAPGGCAPKTLQWLRYLIATQKGNHWNQVAKQLQGLSAAASKCRVLNAQPPRCREFGERSPQRCNGFRGRSFRVADGSKGLQPLKEIRISIWELYVKDRNKNCHMVQFGTDGVHNSQT